MNLADNLIKDAFAKFCSLEHTLLESVDPKERCQYTAHLSWIWTFLFPSETVSKNETLIAVQNYITRLKDCTVNWLYEIELYYGKTGGEIRTFG